MRLSVGLILCVLLSPSFSYARAQSPAHGDSPAPSEVTTSGRGESRITPDRATVLVSIESRAGSAAEATSANSLTTSATIKAIKAAVSPTDVVTTESFSVNRDYDKNSRPTGFIARNSVRIQLGSIAGVGAIVDAALAGGATQVLPVQFAGSRTGDARRAALNLAVTEARLDAEAMAAAAGGSLGRLLSLSSTTGGAPSQTYYQTVMATGGLSAAPSPPMLPNDLTITAVVNGRWEFLPRHPQ
jgi:uncharacterized protein YggE